MIETVANAVWLVPLLPLIGALVSLLAQRQLRAYAYLPVAVGVGVSALISLILLFGISSLGHATEGSASVEHGVQHLTTACRWLEVAGLNVPVEFRVDPLSVMMISMVTFVATLIIVFAGGYMSDDCAQPRFFALVGLFVSAMTGLVLSNNFVLTYVFWEGVGVCSYLLIGHYHAKPSAAAAAQKAFLVNRIGDVGFALAIFWMWSVFGHSLRYDDILTPKAIATLDPNTAAGIALLLFWAACAKSAQFPLYTWLPDAMEGPTPVSALIHAATMVTAGVYLVARSGLLFAAAPGVQLTIAVVGCLTAVLAAIMALVQYDLKRVLAYSTVSQLGYMFMALGSGVGEVARFAVAAAMFHLCMHAFFKALLFLGSGSVMHSMGGVIDMRRFGGLYKRMPWTGLTFLFGSLALAGFPLTSGFFSKDEILVSLHEASISPQAAAPWVYNLIYWCAVLTAALTAFYITRAFCLTFLGPEKLPSPDDAFADPEEKAQCQIPDQGHGHDAGHGHDHGHAHGHELGRESGRILLGPLFILTVFAALAGMALGLGHGFADYVEGSPQLAALRHTTYPPAHLPSVVLGIVACMTGLTLGFLIYGARGILPDATTTAFLNLWNGLGKSLGVLRPFYTAAVNKFSVDETYETFLVTPTRILARICTILDVVLIDPLSRGLAYIPRVLGQSGLARYQNGLIQYYAAASALGVTVLLLILMLM